MWPILMLISTLSFAVSRVIQRALLKDGKHDPITYSIYFQLLVSLIILPIALLNNFSIPNISQIWLPMLFMIILYGFANIFLYTAVRSTPISEVMIITATMPVWTTITSVPLLGESINFLKLLGISLAVVGVAVAFYSKNKFNFNKGHLYAFLSTLFFGLALTNDAFLLGHFNPITYSSIYFFLPAVFLSLVYPRKLKGVGSLMSKGAILQFVIGAVIYAIASLLVNTSYKLGAEMSQISVIMQLSPIFTITLGIILFKEKENLINKILGGILAILGVILIQLKI